MQNIVFCCGLKRHSVLTRMDPYICTLVQDGSDNVLAQVDQDESQTMHGMLFVKFTITTVKLNEVA